jgi:hypothetical protein
LREPFQRTELGCALLGTSHRALQVEGAQLGLQESRSRRPPWHRILRLVRFGRGRSPQELHAAVRALRELAEGGGVHRVHVEGWSEDPDTLEALGRACAEAGFARAPAPRSYRHTLWIDLGPEEEEILAGFHATGRRHIRAPAKKGFEVRTITDARHAGRLEELHRDAFARTGGRAPKIDWYAAVRASSQQPERIRVVGLFEGGNGEGPAVGFAMAFNHGEVAEYAFAGSAQLAGSSLPILYAPTWDLMRWARSLGARWWDFGGVPSPREGSQDDPRSGIADFKRYFGGEVMRVGGEWVYEPKGWW